MSTCLGEAELERLASIGEKSVNRADRGLLRHVARCSFCSAKLDTIRANNRFLAHAGGDLAEALESAAGVPAKPTSRPLPEPGIVPGFQIVEEIGRGGQGVVYRAVQIDTRRPVAIKMLLAGAFATNRQLHRFERETELAAGLRHPNIVTVFQSGVAADGGRYVAMEFVQGVPLDQFVADTLGPAAAGGKARVEVVVRLVLQVARAVGHAHTAGVIHRDIKPGNILVDPQGVPRVLDFGLARTIVPADATQTNVTQDFVGTPAYAAPEQLSAEHETTDARGDVYSLGVVLYRLLTGTTPYPCDGPLAVVVRHVAETAPTPPARYVPRLPADVQTIVLRCWPKSPSVATPAPRRSPRTSKTTWPASPSPPGATARRTCSASSSCAIAPSPRRRRSSRSRCCSRPSGSRCSRPTSTARGETPRPPWPTVPCSGPA